MKSTWKILVAGALLAGSASFAAAPPETGNSCFKSDGWQSCEGTSSEGVTAICDVNGNAPGSSCSETDPQTCKCFFAECLSTEHCPATFECNTMTWKCEAAADTGGGSGTSGCSSAPGSAPMGLLPLLFGLVLRRPRNSGKDA